MRQQPTALHEHRPLARTVLRLENPGMPIAEIAWQLRRSPQHIAKIETYADAKLARGS